jgi:hypothetical protein
MFLQWDKYLLSSPGGAIALDLPQPLPLSVWAYVLD